MGGQQNHLSRLLFLKNRFSLFTILFLLSSFAHAGIGKCHETLAGNFPFLSKEKQAVVLEDFRRHKANGFAPEKITEGKIRRVGEGQDQTGILVNFNEISTEEFFTLVDHGEEDLDKLVAMTSAAGAGTRTGRVVKALLPLNLQEVLQWDYYTLEEAGNNINTKREKSDTRETIRRLLVKAMGGKGGRGYNLKGLNPLDLKFVNAALASMLGKTYVPFKIFTGDGPHQDVYHYRQWLINNLEDKVFHPDAKVDAGIKAHLKEYFYLANDAQDGHIVGYQEGVYAINANSGQFETSSPPIGKGLGSIIEAMKKTGEVAKLKSMGKSIVLFDNIEVITAGLPLLGVHRKNDQPISVVLVPQKEGYFGGAPFFIKEGGEWSLQLREMSALPDEYANGNRYFNSNTMLFPLDIKSPGEDGFESKENGRIYRVKLNLGNITYNNGAQAIIGRILRKGKMGEYANVKYIRDYGENGQNIIDNFQDYWEYMLYRIDFR